MPLPKQKHSPLSSLLWYCVLIVSFFAFISCDRKLPPNNETANKKQPISSIKKNDFTPPKVTYITAANQPKTIIAGKPIIKKDSTNGGTPFFTNYGTEQGLPSNFINKSILDKSGNLWFGAQRGACRYDGKRFTTFTDANGMLKSYVYSIFQDNEKNFWFGTEGGGRADMMAKRS
jgi:hypothetical protein